MSTETPEKTPGRLRHEEPFRIKAEQYRSSREKATGRVELEIGGGGRTVVIDLGDDGDEILAGLLGFHERDDEDPFFDEDEELPEGVEEVTTIVPIAFMVETEETVGATLVRMVDHDGHEVNVGLDGAMRGLLVSMLGRKDGAS